MREKAIRGRRAFTLVELLVVIGIISVLVAILLPALNKARQQAKTLQCLSQMRQISMACKMYVGINKGKLPPFLVAYVGPPTSWASAFMLMEQAGFLPKGCFSVNPTSPILLCPVSKVNAAIPGGPNPGRGNYAISSVLCGQYNEQASKFTPTPSVGSIHNSSHVILFLEAGQWNTNWYYIQHGVSNNYIPGVSYNAGQTWDSVNAGDAILGRHPNKTINIGFVDGHCANVPVSALEYDELHNKRSMWVNP